MQMKRAKLLPASLAFIYILLFDLAQHRARSHVKTQHSERILTRDTADSRAGTESS